MIDTMNICFNSDQLKGIDLQRHLLEICEVSSMATHQQDNREWITGNIGNYKVSASSNYLSLKGSLSKWYLGNNIHEFTPNLLKEAIATLSDTLSLPIGKARISRLDISGNLFVSQKPEHYFPLLEYATYYKRFQQPNSLYFQKTSEKMLFYDKVKESKAKQQVIPNSMKWKDILRFEYDLLTYKALQKMLNLSDVSPLEILVPDNYNKLVQCWHKSYSMILKKRNMIDLTQVRNSKSFEDLFFAKGLQSEFSSIEAAMQAIELMQEQGFFNDRMQPSRLKAKIKTLYQEPAITTENPLITELDLLIESKYKDNLM